MRLADKPAAFNVEDDCPREGCDQVATNLLFLDQDAGRSYGCCFMCKCGQSWERWYTAVFEFTLTRDEALDAFPPRTTTNPEETDHVRDR